MSSKKARVWKAWMCFSQNDEPCVELVWSTRERAQSATAMLVGRSWFALSALGVTIRRVEIREVLPRKAGARRGK